MFNSSMGFSSTDIAATLSVTTLTQL